MMSTRVFPVRSRSDHDAFCEAPFAILRGDPTWVPPLRREERKRWSAAHNASLSGRWVQRFLACRGRDVVGRVAVIEDDGFSNRWLPQSAFFGFFECIDDRTVAAALLDTAEETMRRRGRHRSLGPVNLTTHDETGLLVEGFGVRPAVLTPYNPPYYPSLLEANGYNGYRDYHAFHGVAAQGHARALKRLARAWERRVGAMERLTIRTIDSGRWDEEVATLRGLYNGAFTDVWGFVPISPDEFRQRAESFRPFYRPELVLLAEMDDAPVGFGFILPDINEVLATLRGSLFPLGWLRLVRGIPRIRSGRFILIGVLPGYTGLGIAPLIALGLRSATVDLGISPVEISLVAAGNDRMQHVIEAFGCVPSRTCRLYLKEL